MSCGLSCGKHSVGNGCVSRGCIEKWCPFGRRKSSSVSEAKVVRSALRGTNLKRGNLRVHWCDDIVDFESGDERCGRLCEGGQNRRRGSNGLYGRRQAPARTGGYTYLDDGTLVDECEAIFGCADMKRLRNQPFGASDMMEYSIHCMRVFADRHEAFLEDLVLSALITTANTETDNSSKQVL
eukprot:TRINITY_DN40289_c0_g1_i1.p1 TRINITY_DN40289_c0_g1~~TRINITY_DN40289_c0_g1_i1.p1  ORF type:complete len:182 (+),score=12.93 TRINITY_DN40289_c0_g1_i1:121-666(+)